MKNKLTVEEVAALVFAARVGQKASVTVRDTAFEALRFAEVFMEVLEKSRPDVAR